MFVGCFFTWSVMLLVLATLPSLPVTLAALAVGGFAAGPLNPVLGAVEYERIPARLRGRVFGAITAGAWATVEDPRSSSALPPRYSADAFIAAGMLHVYGGNDGSAELGDMWALTLPA